MTFWKLWVRTPSLLIAAASIGLGAWGAVDWAPALAAACLGAFSAKAADRMATRTEMAAAEAKVVEFPAGRTSGTRYDRAA